MPPFSKVSSDTRGSSAKASRTRAAVPSLEPSSSTSTSSRFQLEWRMRATEATMTFSSLKQGISTLTKGPVSGSSIGGVRAGAVKRCHSASVARNASRATPRMMAVMNNAFSMKLM